MVPSSLKLVLLMTALAVVLTGCQGSIRGPQAYEHAFNRTDCAPGPKPCPRECPDFPLPPGGPYLTTPGIHAPLNPNIQGGQEISVKRESK